MEEIRKNYEEKKLEKKKIQEELAKKKEEEILKVLVIKDKSYNLKYNNFYLEIKRRKRTKEN
jgi:hypothetical protein